MKVCIIGKYPPIEGGVSARTYWTAQALARAGHNVVVVTNAAEVEPEHREWFLPGDEARLEADHPGGGSVRVCYTQPRHDEDLYYIPDGKPTLTRLASVAAEVVRRDDCEVIIGWYLEPYALAANMVAAWTGRPYLVVHAGSDLYELAAQPELGPAYREVIRASAGVLSSVVPVEGLGLPRAKAFGFPGVYMPAEFEPAGEAMDLAATARYLKARGAPWMLRTEPLPAGTVVVGAYGKLGVAKGTHELVRAVERVRASGQPVALALAGGGRGRQAVMDEIDAAGIADVTVSLPMIAPWQVPSFIRACTVVSFLEREFGVAEHRPVVPLEILACGRPLLLSAGVVPTVLPGRPPDDPLFDAVEVVDPRDAGALAAALTAASARPAPTADQLDVSLRTETEVAQWYGSVFARVTGSRGGAAGAAGEQPVLAAVTVEAVTAEAVSDELKRRCPVLASSFSPAPSTGPGAAPNALLAAYLAADAVMADVHAALSGADAGSWGLAQLALAEYHALWSRVDVESAAGLAAFPTPVQRLPAHPRDGEQQLDALFPVASNWLRVDQFEVDAFAHLEAVARRHGDPGRAAAKISGPPQILLFQKTPTLASRVSRIGPIVRGLLDAADGTRSLHAHATALGVEPDRLRGFTDVVWKLHDTGVLLFRRDSLA